MPFGKNSIVWLFDTFFSSGSAVDQGNGAFGTNRVSTEVVSKWKKFNMDFITTITNTCGDVIR